MRSILKPLAALLLAIATAGCAGQGGLFAETPQAGPQADPQAQIAIVTGTTPEPVDALADAKAAYRNRNFGLAEKGFRRAVETSPNDVEAWLGLAAAHDQLGRFDLADKEYAQAQKRGGLNVGLLNNRGYSHMLRGDVRGARSDFLAAQRLEPDNPFVQNNLRQLDARAAARS